MAVEVYRVMFVNQVAVNVMYSCLDIEILKLYPSISLIDDSAAATQPLSRSARVADVKISAIARSIKHLQIAENFGHLGMIP